MESLAYFAPETSESTRADPQWHECPVSGTSEKELNYIFVQRSSQMDDCVPRLAQHFEVFQAIIEPVVIPMMHILGALQEAPKMPLHNESVLVDATTAGRCRGMPRTIDKPIASVVDVRLFSHRSGDAYAMMVTESPQNTAASRAVEPLCPPLVSLTSPTPIDRSTSST
jgi:hypothetical protein